MAGSQDRSEEKPTDTFMLLPVGAAIPDMEQITSVSIIPFNKERKIVAALLSHRGLDIPGGHTEVEDTSLEDVARRETLEEICATLADDLKVAGIIQSSRQRNGKPTYMVVMTGSIQELLPLNFAPDEKSIGRKEVSVGEFVSGYKSLSFMSELVARACHIHHGTMVSNIRIGFAGAGVHAVRAHAKHLKNINGARIYGVFDPSDASVENLRRETGSETSIKRYTSYEDMLVGPDVDAVLIGSPDRFHLPQLEAAIKAGKHAFCEKPMCADAKELKILKAILREAKAAGLVVTSCHPRRFDPPYVWLKDHLPELTRKYGKPIELRMDFQYHKPDIARTGLHGGSLLQDHMNHEFDYLNYLFGSVPCHAHKLLDEENRYHVAGSRSDGIVFSFGGTRHLDTPTYAETIDVRFERATLHIDTYNQGHSFIHDHEDPYGSLLTVDPGITDYDVRFRAVNENWLNTMRYGLPGYLTKSDMLGNSLMSVGFAGRSKVRYVPTP